MGVPVQESRVGAPDNGRQAVLRGEAPGGLPETLKLYGARHAFATYAVEATGNVFAVADAMGHEDLKTTRLYQHPELGAIRDAIDQRNNRRVM